MSAHLPSKNYYWFLVSLFFLLLLLGATTLAYLKLIPVEIKNIPYYDSVGHFLLFGMLALSLDRVLRHKNALKNFPLPTAVLIVGVYAIADESLQAFSSVRALELSDLLFGLLGIICLTILGRKSFQNPNAS